MHLEKDFVMEVYKEFFEDKHFYHEFANLEDKKDYKRCNRIVTSNNPIDFEMREYYPVASNRQGKYNVYPDNLIVYNNKSIKTAIEHDLGNSQDVILISNEGLTFLRQLYECEITYDPAIIDDVLQLFSIYEVFKSIKSCISAYVSPHDSHTFYATYLLYIKMGCGTGNVEQCSKCIIELISRLLKTKKHCKCRKCANSIFDECKNILTICKVKFEFSKNLQTIVAKAMNDLVAMSPLHFDYSIVKNAMIDLIAKINYQKHYSEIRDILREFHRNECKTRFFKNFNLYDFLLFYLFYLKEISNYNIKNLIFTMKAKLNVDFTHEKLSIDPMYIFDWYFKCYCKLFEQTCENNRKIRYIINGKRYLKRKVKPTIRIKIVSQKVQTKGSGEKIYPFSPMVERIKECGNKGHLYAAKKRLYFD